MTRKKHILVFILAALIAASPALSAAKKKPVKKQAIKKQAVKKQAVKKNKKKTSKKKWRAYRYGKVNNTGWFSIKDFEKKRLLILRKGTFIADSVIPASSAGSDAATILVMRDEARGEYSIVNAGSEFDVCDSFGRIKSGSGNEDFFVYKNSEGVFLLAEGSRFGPFDSIEKCSYDPTGRIWYAYGTLEGRKILLVNGNKYGPYDEIGGLTFSRDSERFGFQYRIGYRWRIYINGSVFGYFDTLPPWLTLSSQGGYAYTYTADRMDYISVKGRAYGPYKWIGSLYLSHDGKNSGFIYKHDFDYYINYNGIVHGPFDYADSLTTDVSGNSYTFRYRKGRNEFIVVKDKTYGPYISAGTPVLAANGLLETTYEKENGHFILINGTEYPVKHKPVSYFFTGNGSSLGYLYRSYDRTGLVAEGEDYGLYDEILPCSRKIDPDVRSFYAVRGINGYIINVRGNSVTSIPLPSDYIKGSAGYSEDGKTPVWAVKKSGSVSMSIGGLKLGPYKEIFLNSSRVYSSTEWIISGENNGSFIVNYSGKVYELAKSYSAVKNYSELAFNIISQSAWYSRGINNDGNFFVLNGRFYGPDVINIKYIPDEKIILWLTLEGRSVYINRLRLK